MKEEEWYDDPDLITNMLIGLLILIVIVSQSVAIRHQLGLGVMFRSLLNYNCIYLIFLTYLILLKTKVGKRYFHILNVCLIAIQSLVGIASLLNIFQAFSISNVVNFFLNLSVLFYMGYVLLKDTSLWKVLRMDKIPFSNIQNQSYFYAITALSFLLLVVGLFGEFTFDGIVLALLKSMFIIGWTRYLYLYESYQEKKIILEEEKQQKELKELKQEEIKQPSEKKPRQRKSSSKKKEGETNESSI